MEASGRDRYDALLRHLQAGRELQVQPRRRTFGLDIHPSAGKVALGALIIVVLWLGAITVTDFVRVGHVDTWNGPDDSVQSGLRLAGCPEISFVEDVYFPSWLRFEGKVYRWTESGRPIGPDSIGTAYLETGYTLGDLVLLRIANEVEGLAGNQVLVRQGTSMVGAVYAVTDCA